MTRDKLIEARMILISSLSNYISSELLHPIRPVLKVEFINNFTLYIRYNYVGEYSYHIQLGSKELDRVRFDNMDDQWSVPTKPHHFHEFSIDDSVLPSNMSGVVEKDIPILVKFISDRFL